MQEVRNEVISKKNYKLNYLYTYIYNIKNHKGLKKSFMKQPKKNMCQFRIHT